jgi:lysine biosynthesis protein LysW
MNATHADHECQVCGQPMPLGDDHVLGELLDCNACGTEFEVTAVEPLHLIEAPMAGEDWGQ